MIAARFRAETDAPGVKARDTAEVETPARIATSRNVTGADRLIVAGFSPTVAAILVLLCPVLSLASGGCDGNRLQSEADAHGLAGQSRDG
jgi:hypothetical protein